MKLVTILFLSTISINSWAVKVLQIGDSHTVGPFGSSLYESLSSNTNVESARSIGLSSARGRHYAADDAKNRTLNYGYIDRPKMKSAQKKGTVDKLSTLLNNDKPDILIVELADNFADYGAKPPSDGFAKKEVQNILGQIAASQSKPSECFWVGPTWTDRENFPEKSNFRAQQVAALIKKEIEGKCTFIDSLAIIDKSKIKTVDGTHCTATSGKLWGQHVYEAIVGKSTLLSATPIKKNAGSTNN